MSPKEECEILLEALLFASENLLKKNGEFYPMGAVLSHDTKVIFTTVNSVNEYPDSQDVINDLLFVHREMAQKNEIKVSGIAWNSTFTSEGKQSDVIVVSLEHQDNYSVIVGLPYKIGLFKKIKFGEMFAQSGNNDVFEHV